MTGLTHFTDCHFMTVKPLRLGRMTSPSQKSILISLQQDQLIGLIGPQQRKEQNIKGQHLKFWKPELGAAKSIVRIAQVVPQPVRTSGNFQEFII